MPPTSQRDALPTPPWIFRAIADRKEIQPGQFWYQLSLPYRRRDHWHFASLVRPSLKSLSGSSTVGNRQALTSSESLTDRFCSTPSSVFDTRLYSVTGSGHIRRPAELGLLLRYAPLGFGSSQNKFAPKPAQNDERISFGSLQESRPSALGSRAHSRGFAMCDPSKFGNSKRRTAMYLTESL
jgi:hypothetical protein